VPDEEETHKNLDEQWTRVFKRNQRNTSSLPSFPLGPDLLLDSALRDSLSDISESQGETLFSPLLIKQKELDLNLDNHRLS